MSKYCLALDLIDDAASIKSYEKWHKAVWPEILQSIQAAGIEQMQIYRAGNRLFMIMKVNETFSFEAKVIADAQNPKVQEWEKIMWKMQQALPFAKPGEKWVLMKKVFDLKKALL
jgi:L-rhamnose mutarotase